MSTYQYKPDLSVKLSPRVPAGQRNAVNRLCKKHDMPEADVLRYSFETAVLLAHGRKLKLVRLPNDTRINSMLTLRTGRAIAKMVREIHARYPEDVTHSDVLRQCLAAILAIAEERGVAHVMVLRERARANL